MGKLKNGAKNVELLFLHGFSPKDCEILHKTFVTSQEYEVFFWDNMRKWGGESTNLLVVLPQVKIRPKRNLSPK